MEFALRSVPFVLALSLILAGCTWSPGGLPVSAGSAESDLDRVTTPDASSTAISELVAGNGAFAFDLYQQVRQGDGNLFYSPYSISMALAMTYAGARTGTEEEMADTLHYTQTQEQLHPAFNALDLALAGRGEGAAGKDGEGFRLNIVNALWGQEGYAFLDTFLDLLALNYGAGMNLLDFAGAPEASRVIINDWVSEQTEGKITDLIPQGLINSVTRLVLTNAIYFNAAWQEPFEAGMTQDGDFHLLDGSAVTVPMMRHAATYGYTNGDGFQAVELPYDGGELSMVVLVPDAGEFGAFEEALDAQRAGGILDDLAQVRLDLQLPKWEVEAEMSLADVLAGMGMPQAFSMGADFSGMDGSQELFIKDVVHKAFVSVDEEGTEAAAATAVVMMLKGMPEEPREVVVDRAFVYMIRDVETGAILFLGRVMNPA